MQWDIFCNFQSLCLQSSSAWRREFCHIHQKQICILIQNIKKRNVFFVLWYFVPKFYKNSCLIFCYFSKVSNLEFRHWGCHHSPKKVNKKWRHIFLRFFAAWQEWQRRWRLCGKWKCKYYSVCGPGNDMYRFSHYIRGTGWQRVSHAGTQTDWAQFSGLWSLFCSLKSLVLHCTLMLQSMLQMLWKNRRQRGTHLRYSKCIFYLYGTIDFS